MIPLKYNLRSLRVRKVSTIMTALGIALVTAIFVALLSLGEGVRKTLVATGHPKNLIVLRDGPTVESQSSIPRQDAGALTALPGISLGADGEPLASPETVVIVSATKPDGGHANIVLRGVRPVAWEVRTGLQIEGRWFSPGSSEAVIGKVMTRRFPNLRIGARKIFKNVEYEIVGIFDAQGRAYESEIWADGDTVMTEFGRPYSSILVRANDPAALAKTIDEDPRFVLKGTSEVEYFAKQTEMADMIMFLAVTVALVLGTGACFGAAITMYASVASRVREIATLRVLGYTAWGIGLGFILEAAVIAVPGGIFGACLALPINGVTTGTTNWQTFTEVAFNFTVTPSLMIAGAVMATLLGLAGGFFPAIRAARLPIAQAMRQL